MARKVFVSYKYADNDVYPLDDSFYGTTVRTYVDKFERRVENNGVCIYKGEKTVMTSLILLRIRYGQN